MIGGDVTLNVNFTLSELYSARLPCFHELWRMLHLQLHRNYYNGISNY